MPPGADILGAHARLAAIDPAAADELLFTHVLSALLGEGTIRLLLDLERTKIVNSIGISILIEVLEKVLDQGGRLAFCHLTPTIEKTFQIMGLAQYARIFPTPEPALSWLRGEAE